MKKCSTTVIIFPLNKIRGFHFFFKLKQAKSFFRNTKKLRRLLPSRLSPTVKLQSLFFRSSFYEEEGERWTKEGRRKMLKFLSKVRIEFNALDPRTAACMELLAQCNARKAKESNPSCQLQVKRRTDDHPPQITITFVNGVEEVFDATSTSAHHIRSVILDKGQMLETEQMFRDAGESWPVLIPEAELLQTYPGTKVCLPIFVFFVFFYYFNHLVAKIVSFSFLLFLSID